MTSEMDLALGALGFQASGGMFAAWRPQAAISARSATVEISSSTHRMRVASKVILVLTGMKVGPLGTAVSRVPAAEFFIQPDRG